MTDRILTTRMEAHPEDSNTIERFEATEGYGTLRKALSEMTPDQILEEVKAANLRDAVLEHYLHFGRVEKGKFDEAVTTWERARYLERA